jgi:arsenate reductase
MLTIWHNPRCSKSRATLALIEEAGAAVEIRRYIEDAPLPAELDAVLEALDLEPPDLVRWNESIARELDLRNRDLTRAEWLETLAEHPITDRAPGGDRGRRTGGARPAAGERQ